MYACKDRTIQPGRLVQDGYLLNDPSEPVYRWITNPWGHSPKCGYLESDTDERCEGCKLKK